MDTKKAREFPNSGFLDSVVCVQTLKWIMGQRGRSIRQIREKFQKDRTVGKGRVPSGNCTDGLIISGIS